MYHQYPLLRTLPFLLTIAVLYFQDTDQKIAENTINRVSGDKSYIEIFGKKPGGHVPDQLRIRTHLRYAEQILRERPTDHLSAGQQKNRARYLDMLIDYYQAGEFPHNDGHSGIRRPTFIDNNGNICAVGYLLEQSAGRQVAESVNKKYKYAFITDIDESGFKKWAKTSGFRFKELAMIQPQYGGNIISKMNF